MKFILMLLGVSKFYKMSTSTELINACMVLNLEKAEELLQQGVDINETDEDGDTALTLCCLLKYSKAVALLLKYGADVNKADREGNPPLFCVAKFYRDLQMRAYILGSPSKDNFLQYPGENTDIMRMLLDKGADINQVNHKGNNALLQIMKRRYGKYYFDVVKLLVERGIDLKHRNKQGQNALHLAFMHCADYSVVDLLLEKEIKIIYQKDNLGRDALFYCCEYSYNYKYFKLLLKNGLSIHTKDSKGNTPFVYLVDRECCTKILRKILNKDISLAYAKDKNNISTIFKIRDSNILRKVLKIVIKKDRLSEISKGELLYLVMRQIEDCENYHHVRDTDIDEDLKDSSDEEEEKSIHSDSEYEDNTENDE